MLKLLNDAFNSAELFVETGYLTTINNLPSSTD